MIDIGPPSEIPISAARSEPAASSTACRSSIDSSSVGGRPMRSELPCSRLSNRISRAKPARRSKTRWKPGICQATSKLLMKPGAITRSIGPSPTVA